MHANDANENSSHSHEIRIFASLTKSQIFFWLLLAFIAGITFASFVSLGVTAVAAFFIFGGSVVSFGLLYPAERTRIIVIGFLAIAFAGGALRFLFSSSAAPPALGASVGERITLEGIIDDDPVRRSQSQEFIIRNSKRTEVKVIVRPFPEYHYGDRVRAVGKLERAYNNREFRMAFPEISVLASAEGSPVYRALFYIKRQFSDALRRHLPEPEGSFLTGLLLGERQSFPPSLKEDLQRTGTTHIVALSGYNITILAEALHRIFGFLWLPGGMAWWLSVAGILAFTLLTGAAASVVRAAIMGILVLLAHRSGRAYHMRNALALAAAFMLVHDPTILRFDIGFQLSFLATLGLLYVAPIFDRWFERIKIRAFLAGRDIHMLRERRDTMFRSSPPWLLRNVFIATLAAQAAVFPLLIFYFGELSLISPLANLAVLPLIPYTMFSGFLTGGLGLIADGLGRSVAPFSQLLLSYELGSIGWFSRLPAASITIRGLGPAMLMAMYAALIFFVRRARSTPLRYAEPT